MKLFLTRQIMMNHSEYPVYRYCPRQTANGRGEPVAMCTTANRTLSIISLQMMHVAISQMCSKSAILILLEPVKPNVILFSAFSLQKISECPKSGQPKNFFSTCMAVLVSTVPSSQSILKFHTKYIRICHILLILYPGQGTL